MTNEGKVCILLTSVGLVIAYATSVYRKKQVRDYVELVGNRKKAKPSFEMLSDSLKTKREA